MAAGTWSLLNHTEIVQGIILNSDESAPIIFQFAASITPAPVVKVGNVEREKGNYPEFLGPGNPKPRSLLDLWERIRVKLIDELVEMSDGW